MIGLVIARVIGLVSEYVGWLVSLCQRFRRFCQIVSKMQGSGCKAKHDKQHARIFATCFMRFGRPCAELHVLGYMCVVGVSNHLLL